MSTPVDAPAWAAALARELEGRWPGMAQRVYTDRPEADRLSAEDLARPAVIAGHIERFTRAHPDVDAPALASLWTQWYAATTWPALAAGAVLLEAAPRIEDMGIVLDEVARPLGVVVGDVQPVEPAAFLESLARRQAAPLMAAAAATGLSPRVPWSNAINVLGWTLDQLRARVDEARVARAFAVLECRHWPDGTVNPLAGGGPPAGGRPARRVCCLRYRLAGFDYCGDCPIPERRRVVTRGDAG